MLAALSDWLCLVCHVLFVRPLCILAFRVKVTGRDRIPRDKPFVLVANHNSHLDVLLLYFSIPLGRIPRTHVVAARDYFAKHPLLRVVASLLFRPIWIDRTSKKCGAVAAMGTRLDAGENVVLFPEGTRGEPGRLGRFHEGIGRLAKTHRHVPVFPVLLSGSERALPRGARFPRPVSTRVLIAPARASRGSSLAVTAELRRSICRLADVQRKRSPFVVALVGVDGSGKSSVSKTCAAESSFGRRSLHIGDSLQMFRDGSSVALFPSLWEGLRRRIGRYAKGADSLARYKIPKIIELLLRDRALKRVARRRSADIVFMDGAPLLNLTAWSALYSREPLSESAVVDFMRILSDRADLARDAEEVFRRFPELRCCRRLGLAKLRVPDCVLFLDVSPAVAVARVSARGEPLQVHETREKLGRLRGAYETTLRLADRELGIPTATIDADRPLDSVMEMARRFVADCQERDDETAYSRDRDHGIRVDQRLGQDLEDRTAFRQQRAS